MVDTTFEPRDLTVPVGTTVTWVNEDSFPHTVTKTSGAGGDFDSGEVPEAGTFENTFTEPGTVEYVCTIHPGMEGTVTVEG